MRILVVSDTHKNVNSLRTILLAQPTAELVIHLGDGEDDVALLKPSFPEKMFLQVRGNCDWGSNLPDFGTYTAEGVKIFYTHGHLYGVKSGLYLMNPGSAGYGAPSYGTLDITPQGIVTNIVKLP